MKNYSAATAALFLFSFLLMAMSCSKSTDTVTTTGSTTVPAVFSKFNSTVTISVEGNFVVLKSNGLPEHKSPYYQGTVWAATLYEAYNGTNPLFMINPNRIAQQSLTFTRAEGQTTTDPSSSPSCWPGQPSPRTPP